MSGFDGTKRFPSVGRTVGPNAFDHWSFHSDLSSRVGNDISGNLAQGQIMVGAGRALKAFMTPERNDLLVPNGSDGCWPNEFGPTTVIHALGQLLAE